ncbi:MarR family transcriptional regulator [Curtobacterium sp. MCSS17_011]|uniref:MarR family winged helix-turn-helix transcriptional regulator n=1 Tax=Curtobacterium sp. MCSS17_011 TaxID=2175643 RepID=UPI000D8AAD0B|nr:MarR family winged helix-turn-helix transcriptional regulator [Curtobacterium sp. MCSS17_011]PYY60648.1 MarR family transcriptional regulator [Curtobacterium sp. MCSS17_011]
MLDADVTAEDGTPAAVETAAGATTTDTDNAFIRIERQFMAIFALSRHSLREQAAQMDLQPVGYRVLVELVVIGSSGAGDLAEALGIDKAALSRQLSHLESLGLVTRERHVEDRRAVVIRATPIAINRIQSIRDSARSAFRERLGSWPHHDLEELARLLAGLL